MVTTIIGFLFGWVLDLLFGDPVSIPHPIVWFGKWISFWEKRLNKSSWRMTKGALFAVLSVVMVFILAAIPFVAVHVYTDALGVAGDAITILLTAVAVFFCLAGKTLRQEVRMVFDAVDRSTEDGRRQVARIVGRDTSSLTDNEIRTAALETLAENLSDGVVAPLFWFAVLGVPGMLMYKMINTLDSMIGYHSERYLRFGCWAARIDDVANFIPARLTALLMILVSGKNPFRLLGFVLRFGSKHASPNSGQPESALAGILDCRFGGPHHYFGEYFYKPYIGTNARPLTHHDATISLRIALHAEILAVALMVLVIHFFIHFFGMPILSMSLKNSLLGVCLHF